MLTPSEQIELTKLKEKANSYVPLTQSQFDVFEKEVAACYPGHVHLISAVGNLFADTLGKLAKQNSQLIQEVLYWKARAQEKKRG